jgi:mitogen-activated protein kinase kinase
MQGASETTENSKFNDFHKIMDPSGSLKFSKAVLHAGGVDFGDGQSFKINMDEMEVLGELGKGNYGSVQKVFHRPTGVYMAMKVSYLTVVAFADGARKSALSSTSPS